MGGHNQLVQMIKNLGQELELEIERAEEEDFVVPSFDMFCPKEKEAKPDASDYYKEAMKYGLGPDSEIPAMFTACGKPRLKTGKYNTSVTLYSEETLMELSSSGGHGFVDPEKLHPVACCGWFDRACSCSLLLIHSLKLAWFRAFVRSKVGTRV